MSERRLFDSHVHLQDEPLASELEAVLQQAAAVGARLFVCNGTGEHDWPRVTALAKQHRQIIPCVGLHPWHAARRSPGWFERLEACLDGQPAGIGEIGLDRWIEPRDEPAQEEVFRRQLELARRRRLPVTIHCVRAWGWLLEVLRSEPPLAGGLLFHAFGGSPELVKLLADMGAYFSFAGNTLDERKQVRRETLPLIPPDRLLLETDAPDLSPPELFRPFSMRDARGKSRNHPANLGAILEGIAALLGEDPQDLADRVWENSRRFFGSLMREDQKEALASSPGGKTRPGEDA